MEYTEYMILADGSLRTFNAMYSVIEISEMLKEYGGVAYYWQSLDGVEWYVMSPEASKGVRTTDIPDVIKLAKMLE